MRVFTPKIFAIMFFLSVFDVKLLLAVLSAWLSMCTCRAWLRKTGQKYKGGKKRGMDLSSFWTVTVLIRDCYNTVLVGGD